MNKKEARRKARRISKKLGQALSADDRNEVVVVEQEWAEISDDFPMDSDEIPDFDFPSSDWE